MTSLLSILPQTPPEITLRTGAISKVGICRDASTERRAPTFAIYTLGCKVNQSDSSVIARVLQQQGFRRVTFKERADLYVIDTCTVTNEADRKSRKAAARAHRNNPDALVAVTGCAATYAADQFARVAPDALVLSNARKFELPELALKNLRARRNWNEDYARWREETASEPIPISTLTRAVLKIQDGCNHNCSYCIIPTVRGVSTLKSRAAIVDEAKMLLEEGAREIIVTGVSMGDFSQARSRKSEGRSSCGRNGALCDLLRELSTLDGLSRLRVSSLDPADVDEEYLQTIAGTPKICPHIHLALQSGSASTLHRMRRRYTPELFLKWARRWHEIAPHGGLTTDIIVGFPGEIEGEFQDSVRVAREAKFSAIHVFPYSPRAGTVASEMGNFVEPKVQNRRVQELLTLADELSAGFTSQFIRSELPVLIETIENGVAEGLTENYLKTRVVVKDEYAVGDVVGARVENWQSGVLSARQI
jgi:threonylcarbamoyladenosine tRNA methylthiotransferase MtaB